jgi:tRNA threonylcarbamoyladenosine biosynthesis protein TsaB
MHDSTRDPGSLLLGIDTCGPVGSVALGRLNAGGVEILGQKELAGRTYSATLVAAIEELLEEAKTSLRQILAVVVVSGPGSFTGVRVGLSAAKGMAEGAGLPIAAVSRLEVLAAKAGVTSSALDAHRHEVFLRIDAPSKESRELAGREELAAIDPPPARIAICDEADAALLHSAWPAAEIVSATAPTAADALALSAPRIERGEFAQRGNPRRPLFAPVGRGDLWAAGAAKTMNAPAQTAKTPQFEIRPMRAADLNEVVTLAATLEHAPTWPPAAYARALDSSLSPFRIALVAADSASGALAGFAIAAIAACEPPEAELEMIGVSAPFRRRGLALRLFASLIGELRRAGVREIYLEVRASNQPALALYYVLALRKPACARAITAFRQKTPYSCGCGSSRALMLAHRSDILAVAGSHLPLGRFQAGRGPWRNSRSMIDLSGKTAVIFGLANKRSIAWGIAQKLHEAGAKLAICYQNERMKAEAEGLIRRAARRFRLPVRRLQRRRRMRCALRARSSRSYGKILTPWSTP